MFKFKILILKVFKEIKRIRWIKKKDLVKNTVVVIVISIISAFLLYFENMLASLIFKILKFFFNKINQEIELLINLRWLS